MKLSRNKKIILLTSTIGILTTSILVPIVVLNNKEDQIEKKEDEIEKDISPIEIKSKIKSKDLIIPKNIKTFSDDEILLAIKNQLKKQNSSLTNNDLSKITDNIWHLKPGKKTFVILTIKSQGLIDSIKVNVTKEKNIKLWTKDSAIVKNSNITDGAFSSFIQDSSGNFWSMGGETETIYNSRISHLPTKLQVLKRNGEQWEEDITSGLTKGSNIVNGTNGVIFEDDFGNIWSMGKGTKLQVLVKNKDGSFANSWANDNEENGEKLLQGSKINDGKWGFIFQDSFGNLWAMGKRSKLQVLVKNKDGNYASSWINDNTQSGEKILKNSNIVEHRRFIDGKVGTIFQDSFGNLWAMGYGKKLQVLKVKENGEGYVNEGWINDNSQNGDKLLKNSNIFKGQNGMIFQDSFENLWAMGKGSKLQVLKVKENGKGYVNEGWINDNSQNGDKLLKNSNVNYCFSNTIFQDSFGNLWMQGYQKKPQVLEANENHNDYVTKGWKNNNDPINGDKLLKNLKIDSFIELNSFWVFFQDSFKNLWAMGNEVKFQVLKAKPDGSGYLDSWNDDNGNNGEELLKGSNIKNGQQGLVFEDSSRNLWSMGKAKKLQVYDKTLKKWKS